ncbi:MAG: hypothetical protein JWM68_4367 [Verrucomicrobiales bacterium]|nr:hypothetical protein [Verrucomicrobiales bacterium]
MNLEQLKNKLVSAARNNPPSDKVPYAFEKRIMARLTTKAVDVWAIWSRALWRAALTCVFVVAAIGVWSAAPLPPAENDSLSEDFEDAVFASFDQHVEETW